MKTPSSLIAALGALALASPAFSQNATTTPVGAVTITINGSSNGSTYNQTFFSAPLLSSDGITGQGTGKISAVTANTISNTEAGWTASALATAGSPFFINITSGSNAGRLFQITSNTETQVTVNTQGLDLTTLGIQTGSNGDSYEIVRGDTLLGLLGTTADGVIGGNLTQLSANQIDKVLVNDPSSNALLTYYYDSSNAQWRRPGSSVNQGNLVISPKAGLIYYRISTQPLTLTFTGTVPQTASIRQLPAAGTSLISHYYPSDTTLSSLGLNTVPGWRKVNESGVSTSNCDLVVLKVGSSILSYYYDANLSQWRRLGSSSNQGGVAIPAGASVGVIRKGSAGQYGSWSQALPYSLN